MSTVTLSFILFDSALPHKYSKIRIIREFWGNFRTFNNPNVWLIEEYVII